MVSKLAPPPLMENPAHAFTDNVTWFIAFKKQIKKCIVKEELKSIAATLTRAGPLSYCAYNVRYLDLHLRKRLCWTVSAVH